MNAVRTLERQASKATWPPVEYRLPDDIDQIEAGRVEQWQLFTEQPDDSREGRLARLTGREQTWIA